MLTTFTVSSNADSGPGTLRQAIIDSNSGGTNNLIQFQIPGSGVHYIQVRSDLDVITNAVTIDATTQPGYSGTPRIDLEGSLDAYGSGFNIAANSTTTKGFVIGGFYGDGIELAASNCNIQSNYIGTDATGTSYDHNGFEGVYVEGQNNQITNNLISGNCWLDGASGAIVLFGYSDCYNNFIAGNKIGVDVTGTHALGNGGAGILVNTYQNRIGTNGDGVNDAAERNIISGNYGDGIDIQGAYSFSVQNVVAGNYIGTDITGTVAVPNHGNGVLLSQGTSYRPLEYNRVGVFSPDLVPADDGNLISGNAGSGVVISDVTYGNLVMGDRIGTDASGTKALPNGGGGVVIDKGASSNYIGDIYDPVDRNIISGNNNTGAAGIYLTFRRSAL